ncbi:MAG: hypothetical protein ACRDPW_04450, partial [Mycobacteriales bacterium]
MKRFARNVADRARNEMSRWKNEIPRWKGQISRWKTRTAKRQSLTLVISTGVIAVLAIAAGIAWAGTLMASHAEGADVAEFQKQTSVATWQDQVLILDAAAGAASMLDQNNAGAIKDTVNVGRNLKLSAFDGTGTYWLVSGTKKELIGLQISAGGLRVAPREKIDTAKHQLQLSALDSGVAMVDST